MTDHCAADDDDGYLQMKRMHSIFLHSSKSSDCWRCLKKRGLFDVPIPLLLQVQRSLIIFR